MNVISRTAIGSTTPDYYIVGNQVTEDEMTTGILFDPNRSKSNNYLRSICNSVGITESNSRFVKMIHTSDEPEGDEFDNYVSMLKEDIKLSRPKVIIAMGSQVGKVLAKDNFTSVSRSRGVLYEYDELMDSRVLVTYSPNYIMYQLEITKSGNSTELADNFYSDINFARKLVDGELTDISLKKMEVAKTYEEFKEYFDREMAHVDKPAFDIESNAKEPTTEEFRVIGFSLSPDSSQGIYVIRDALEYSMDPDDWDKVVNMTKEYLMRTTPIVHNCTYEIPSILNEWGVRIENFEDTLAMARILMGGKVGAGLVQQCATNLGYPYWDEELGEYMSGLRGVRDGLFPTSAGSARWDYTLLVDEYDGNLRLLLKEYDRLVRNSNRAQAKLNSLEFDTHDNIERLTLDGIVSGMQDYNEIHDYVNKEVNLDHNLYAVFNEIYTKIYNDYPQRELAEPRLNEVNEEYREFKKKQSEFKSEITSFTRREDNVHENLKILISVIDRNYDEVESDEILKSISEEIVRMIKVNHIGVPSYSTIPLNIITKYGAMDAIGTMELEEHLAGRLTKESTDEVDMWNGYRVAKANLLAGVAMSMNGVHWDDDVATREHEWYLEECFTSAVHMIQSGYLDDFIFKNCQGILHDDIMENRMDVVRDVLGDYQMMKTSIRLVDENGSRIRTVYHSRILEELEKAEPGFIESNRDWLLNEVKSNIHNKEVYKDYHDLKTIFNPNSTLITPVLHEILITEDVKVGYILTQLNVLLDDDHFDINSYGEEDQKLFNLIQMYREHDKEVDLYNDSEEAKETGPKERILGKERFNKFKEVLATTQVKSRDIINIMSEGMNLRLESASEPIMIDLFHHFKNTGIDIEDEGTWTKQFRFFYNFRVWKKCNKMISSYITGNKVGRGSVYEVDEKDILDGKDLLVRSNRYKPGTKLREGKKFMMTSPPKVMMTNTMRWSWALHTIPAGSSIKNIYTSRFDGGMTATPDYSQLEVRMIAGASKCKSMLQAFEDGADIHMLTACFTGDTKVLLADGRSLSFEELVEEYPDPDEKFWVYSVDEDDNITLGEARYPRLTKHSELVEVELSNGEKVRCTPDHLWRTRDGYVEAQDLAKGQSITPLYTKDSGKGYEMYYDLVDEVFKFTHQMSSEIQEPGVSFSGMVRHHKNINKLDNRPENLVKMKWEDHIKLHASSPGLNAAHQWLRTEEGRKERVRISTEMYNKEDSPIKKAFDESRPEVGRQFLTKGSETSGGKNFWRDPEYKDSREVVKSSLRDYKLTPEEQERATSNMIETINSDPEELKRRSDHAKNINTNESTKCRQWLSKYNNLLEGNYKEGRRSRVVESMIEKSANWISKSVVELSKTVDEILELYPNLNKKEVLDKVYYNHKVVSVTWLDETEDVYDLTVDKYHNFAIDTSTSSQKTGVFVHNSNVWKKPAEQITDAERRYSKMTTFAILYGSTAQNIANNFMGGDVASATEMYDSFFEGYPELKVWVAERHKEMLTTGKVSCSNIGYFLDIKPEDFHDGEEGAKRAAQNYPIQSQGSMTGGYVANEIDKYFRSNNMLSKLVLYTHDSIGLDIHPDEIFKVGVNIIPLMNETPQIEFGIPTLADITMGASQGQEMDVVDIQSDDMKSGIIKFDGFEDDYLAAKRLWESKYRVVEDSDYGDPHEFYIPRGDLFVPKKAIHRTFGSSRRMVKKEVKIII